jgi:class 3 adenylate cyclase
METKLAAREETATVLFLDIIGFSAASLNRTPGEAFRELKTMFDRVTRIVHQHGGTVDRTLGDGLLAYFTAHDQTPTPGTHADRAIACGIAIHRAQISEGLATPKTQSILPVRIGINSGNVFMGDLGNDERRDFTIIGSTVNFGQRLEAACEMNRIMIGEKTMEFATQFSPQTAGMWARPIIAKSYQDPVPAFEFDPFVSDSDAAQRFTSAFRSFAQMARTEERLSCADAAIIMVTTHGHAQVLNVSRSGVMLRFKHYIARGAVIYVSQVVAKIEHLDMPPMVIEVRWGTPETDGGFLHGCLFKSLNDEQKTDLWELWHHIATRAFAGQSV